MVDIVLCTCYFGLWEQHGYNCEVCIWPCQLLLSLLYDSITIYGIPHLSARIWGAIWLRNEDIRICKDCTSHCSSHRTETNIELYTCHTISYIMKEKKREIIAALLSSLTHNLAEIAQATAALTGLKYENWYIFTYRTYIIKLKIICVWFSRKFYSNFIDNFTNEIAQATAALTKV